MQQHRSGMRAVCGAASCIQNTMLHRGRRWSWASGWQSWPLAARCIWPVQNWCLGYDCIVPVPASGRARGYNVPQLMAVPLARALGIPLYPKALGRTRAKRHQAGLPFEQRLANVAGAFRVTDTELVEGRKVLLVDDVITTGATAAACTQALLAAGAESVFAIALATVEFETFPAGNQPLQENEPEF